MTGFQKQMYYVVLTLSVILILIGVGLWIAGGVAQGYEFGDNEGLPNWDGAGQIRAIPWWGITGLGLLTLYLAFWFKTASIKENKEFKRNHPDH